LFCHFKNSLPFLILQFSVNHAVRSITTAIALVKENPKQKVSDALLREQGISPEVVRRWFNKNYGMTFQAYQRMYRVNTAYQELKGGKAATAAAFDAGYESLSGFGYTYKKILGKSPQKSVNKSVILINRLTTPLGPMFVAATDQGICLLEFVDRKMLETELKDLQRLLQAQIMVGENQYIEQAKTEVAAYFEGKLQVFEVPLDTPGTDFQQLVWGALQNVPYGKTATYQQQAKRIDNVQAVRAVGTANGANRVSIIVPCHRVIGKNGQLTGYGGGLERKRWLLDFERKHLNKKL
ncbi:methylated-DNA--[protein]-cysteine S-methyltransferase, partial [uncultured Microscilla sp.]|uniref:methylated-DNA--[protein]-cysteine S-methyltransferase n=1 Tax=uncultured Microscilla sp. TaxID=432653 RepID=UPI002628000D